MLCYISYVICQGVFVTDMNIVKKAYCRAFQAGFRIALPILPYKNPTILDDMREIPALLRKNGLNKPFIVTDKAIISFGLIKPLLESLAETETPFVIFDDCVPNPTTDLAISAWRIYEESGCDCIISVGGGSPIDVAKAVGAKAARHDRSLEQLGGIMKIHRKIPTLIAIPTTAGTGSEATLAAVLVDAETQHKFAIMSFALIPEYAVLDASTLRSLPKLIAAGTGMDALVHAVEVYVGRSTTKQTRDDAVKATKLIFENVEAAANHTGFEAEKNMIYAAHLAGRAFTRSYVGYVHAVSHSLSGKYNMPHGLTNAVFLPIVLDMYGEYAWKKLADLARKADVIKEKMSDEETAKLFITKIKELNRKLGIPEKMEGIKISDIDEMAAFADKEANPLYPVPVLWDKEELKKIYIAGGAE